MEQTYLFHPQLLVDFVILLLVPNIHVNTYLHFKRYSVQHVKCILIRY